MNDVGVTTMGIMVYRETNREFGITAKVNKTLHTEQNRFSKA